MLAAHCLINPQLEDLVSLLPRVQLKEKDKLRMIMLYRNIVYIVQTKKAILRIAFLLLIKVFILIRQEEHIR